MNSGNVRSLLLGAAVVAVVAAVAVLRKDGPPSSTGSDRTPVVREATASAPALLPRMVDLGADQCIPCKQMAPILAELQAEYAGKATIEFIDIWKNPGTGEPYGVRVIPTQIFFDRDGHEVWRHEGFLSRPEIVAKLKELGAG